MSNKPIVLMYHGIISNESDIPSDREVGAELYDVSLDNFCKQMDYLQSHDCVVTTLREELSSEDKNVIVTFDDGEKNNFSNAFNVLNGLGFPAYFFIAVNNVGKKGYMDWEEITELRDADMIVGSHGLDHIILTGLKDKELEKELIRSKDILEQHLKIDVDSLSIPRGFYNERVLKIALDAGYKNIFASNVESSVKDGAWDVLSKPLKETFPWGKRFLIE